MSGFFAAPPFNPPQPPIAVGAVGSILTVTSGQRVGFANPAPGVVGPAINFSPPPGNVDPNPTGFNSSTGRLRILLSGNTTLIGLPGDIDGHRLIIMVVATGGFQLTLSHQNAGTSQKQIMASTDVSLNVGDAVQLFFDSTLVSGAGAWQLLA
jgi:hypothetical protein